MLSRLMRGLMQANAVTGKNFWNFCRGGGLFVRLDAIWDTCHGSLRDNDFGSASSLVPRGGIVHDRDWFELDAHPARDTAAPS